MNLYVNIILALWISVCTFIIWFHFLRKITKPYTSYYSTVELDNGKTLTMSKASIKYMLPGDEIQTSDDGGTVWEAHTIANIR